MIELLSPAGDEEKMRVAFNYGADAVYFAVKTIVYGQTLKTLITKKLKMRLS